MVQAGSTTASIIGIKQRSQAAMSTNYFDSR